MNKWHIVGRAFYRLLATGGFVILTVFFLKSVPIWQDYQQEQDYFALVEERTIEDYVEYHSIYPRYATYMLGVSPEMVSSRTVHSVDGKTRPIEGHDILYCDSDFDGRFTRIVDSSTWRNANPASGSMSMLWQWEGGLPENPRGVYIPAVCKIRSEIKVCPIPGNVQYCKYDYITSENFAIVD